MKTARHPLTVSVNIYGYDNGSHCPPSIQPELLVYTPEVWSRGYLHCKAGEVDDTVGDQEEHGDKGSNGVEVANKQSKLKGRQNVQQSPSTSELRLVSYMAGDSRCSQPD